MSYPPQQPGQQQSWPAPPPPAPKKTGRGCLTATVVVLVLFLAVLVAVAIGASQGTDTVSPTTTVDGQTAVATGEPAAPAVDETPGQSNARKSAQSYLDFSAFSRDGLIKQLQFEQYSEPDAIYAVDSLGIDWNEQAAKKAAEYLDGQSFSRQGLVDQLVFEGFTPEQAEHGVSTTGL